MKKSESFENLLRKTLASCAKNFESLAVILIKLTDKSMATLRQAQRPIDKKFA
jgi:hypothetical protein